MSYDILIEALLFYKASALSKQEVATALGISLDELTEHIKTLQTRLSDGATTILETETEIQLVTAPAVSTFIDAVRRDELRTEIGKAGAETLAIILYKEPITRAEIDTIRGVNSSVTVRNLMTRGLITRSSQKKNGAGYTFSITPQLLAHLGIQRKQDLPDYGTILDRIEMFETTANSSE